MRAIGLLILAATTLTGCATGPSRADALASLVGRPESDALRVLGAPNRMLEANGHRFLAYEDSGVGYVTGAPFGFGYYARRYRSPSCEAARRRSRLPPAGSRRGTCAATPATKSEPSWQRRRNNRAILGAEL